MAEERLPGGGARMTSRDIAEQPVAYMLADQAVAESRCDSGYPPNVLTPLPQTGLVAKDHSSTAAPLRLPILVVDDDAPSAYSLAEVLAPLGHEIIVAETGTEALQRLSEQLFA